LRFGLTVEAEPGTKPFSSNRSKLGRFSSGKFSAKYEKKSSDYLCYDRNEALSLNSLVVARNLWLILLSKI
jgi:hypothetical protein